MKLYEELSRMRVEEAIQTGLRSQAIRGARIEPRRPAPPEKTGRPDFEPSSQPNWITLFFYWLLGIDQLRGRGL